MAHQAHLAYPDLRDQKENLEIQETQEIQEVLDRKDPPPKTGDAIPLSGHWLYFLETAPNAELGHDGHPKRGGFLPPVSLPRRMWAGGRIEFRAPVRIGDSGMLVLFVIRNECAAGQ